MTIPPKLIQELKTAGHITVLTGAGISAESGIPTFREAQTGLWERYSPEELATPEAFTANPQLVWQWYRWRQEIVQQAKPNPGHLALAEMEARLTRHNAKFTLITQNVDGLHQRAGQQNIIELHGNIHRSKCFNCETILEDDLQFDAEELPRCTRCDGLLRPDVVWFGENLSASLLETAWDAAQNCDVFIAIGTSAVVQPAASLPVVALQNGAILIEVNPNETPISILAAYNLQGNAAEILPRLIPKN